MNTPIYIIFFLLLTVIDCKRKKIKPSKHQSTQESSDFITYLLLTLGLGLLSYLIIRRQGLLRVQKLHSIKKALQVKEMSRKDRLCTMTQMQKEQQIAWFSKQKWVLEQSTPKTRPSQTSLQIIQIKRKQQPIDGSKLLKDYYDAFYVEMRGGSSVKVYGVLMFQKYFMTIVFDKSLSNSRNNTGGYDFKIFEGALRKGVFEGRWEITNNVKLDLEEQQMREKFRQKDEDNERMRQSGKGLKETPSERSFSKDSEEILASSKKTSGAFKLFHL